MKDEFILQKSIAGVITIKNETNDFFTGFSTPDGKGIEFNEFIIKLKEGEKIIIKKAETQTTHNNHKSQDKKS